MLPPRGELHNGAFTQSKLMEIPDLGHSIRYGEGGGRRQGGLDEDGYHGE